MNQLLRYKNRLEFDKILNEIESFAVSIDAKNNILNVAPTNEIQTVSLELLKADAFQSMIIKHAVPNLSDVFGIKEIVLRADKGGLLSMGEILKIKALLRNARLLIAWYHPLESHYDVTDPIFFPLFSDSSLENDIERSILSETEMSDNASGQLATIRKRIIAMQASIRDKLEKIIRSDTNQKYLQDSVVTMRGGRFVVPVKSEHRNNITGMVHDVSSSGSTYFVEPSEVLEANNAIQKLKGDEATEIERILYAFSARISDVSEQLKYSFNAFVDIDKLIAIARYANNIDAAMPKLNDRGYINLFRARHPLIDKKSVVATDVSLGEKYSTLVITGPNTGGKTVTLKTIGLFSLMAMSGIPVPATGESELSVFDDILVDIGDEQSIEQNLSTFSAHVKNLSEILKTANRNSLVLLDELGAGTDPAEGAALAKAILERLRQNGAKVVATTHYGEIKIYAMQTNGVQNASCEFNIETLSPTYRVTIGLPGSSNALLIGKRLGLDDELLETARQNLSSEQKQMEQLLSEIEQLKSEAAAKLDEAQEKTDQAQRLKDEAEEVKQRAEKDAQNKIKLAETKARQLSSDVSGQAFKLLDEIKALGVTKETAMVEISKRAKEIANKESVKILDMAPQSDTHITLNLEPLENVKKGMIVYVPSLSGVATVLNDPDKKGVVELSAGIIKTRINVSELRKPPKSHINQQKNRNKGGKSVFSVSDKKSGKSEINLLGLTVEEAIMEVETFIDAAVLSHLISVRIVHGKGTGALRKAVHSKLKQNKHVKEFRLGRFGEGEDGVTIAELK